MTEDSSFNQNYMEGVSQFQKMRNRGFLRAMLDLMRGKSPELLSFEDVRRRLRLREESYKGLMDIPLDQVKGSVGRYQDFTADFLPRNNDMRERWSRVYASMNSMRGVPPIDVYKVGDVYFVRDGNHRVSVARQMDARTIQAHVTELPTSVPLHSGLTLADIDAKAAYAAFLDETELSKTRPSLQSIELSEPSRYPELMGHIYLHAQVLERLRGQPIATRDAAVDWYDNVYVPAVNLIRKYQILDQVKDSTDERTVADLYLWMVEHLREIRRLYGEQDNSVARKFSDALVDYLAENRTPVPRELLDEDDEHVLLSRKEVHVDNRYTRD